MKRASFKANTGGGFGRAGGGRSLKKTAFYLFGFCSLMVSAATLSETFFGDGGGFMGMLAPKDAAAGELSGVLEGIPGLGGAAKTPGAVLITPTGELTPAQRAWLLEQAKKGAPIPLDGATGAMLDAESAREKRLKLIAEAIENPRG